MISVGQPGRLCVTAALSVALCLAQVTRRDEIVVTGIPEPIPLEEVDRSVTSLPVRGNEAVTRSLADLLRTVPSLDVRARAPGGVQTDVSIRGASFGQTLVLVNGQRLNDPQTGHHSMDLPLPLEAVAGMEVLRGSGSTFYGSDAIGGVVNVITRPPETSEIRLRAGAGNFGTQEQSLTAAGLLGELAEQISVSRDFSSGFRPDRDYRNLSASSLTSWKRSALLLGYSDRPFGADQFYGNFNSWENTKTWFASLTQGIGENTQAAFSFRRHSDLFVLYRDRPDIYANHHASEVFQLAVRRTEPLAPNTALHYGVEGFRDSIQSNSLGDHDRGRASAYLSADFRALRRFSLSIGAREEVYRRFSAQLSPTVAGGVWLSSSWKLRASVSQAFRVPTYTELYYQDPANSGFPGLLPEHATSYETGLDWNHSRRLRASVTAFRRAESNVIDYVRASMAERWQARNIQQLAFTGLEAELRIRQFGLSYTALTGASQALGGLMSKYVFNYPSHAGAAWWQAEVGGAVLLRAGVQAVNRVARSPYALCDFHAARSHGRLRPFVQLTNLAGARYQEILGVEMPGRAILAGLEFRITSH